MRWGRRIVWLGDLGLAEAHETARRNEFELAQVIWREITLASLQLENINFPTTSKKEAFIEAFSMILQTSRWLRYKESFDAFDDDQKTLVTRIFSAGYEEGFTKKNKASLLKRVISMIDVIQNLKDFIQAWSIERDKAVWRVHEKAQRLVKAYPGIWKIITSNMIQDLQTIYNDAASISRDDLNTKRKILRMLEKLIPSHERV